MAGDRADYRDVNTRLVYQLEQLGLDPDTAPVDLETWRTLLKEISEHYAELEETRREVKRRGEERLKSKDEHIASISHELRTPLTSVLGLADALRTMDEADYEDERDALLGVIASEANDLTDLVEDLLTATRSELGELVVATVPVNIHAQIAQVMEGRILEDEDIAIPERTDDAVLAVGDPQKVRQILRNLITNARRYGGDQIAIEVSRTAGTVTLDVLDDGDGLDESLDGRVFEKYVRREGSNADPNSVGLGLTIARDLARRMSGDLAYTRRDGWTVFTLTLPTLIQPTH